MARGAQHSRRHRGGTELSADSCYWARFEERDGALWRFDTRIYGEPRARPRRSDKPLGCIIGKNPGSARPAGQCAMSKHGGRVPLARIELDHDRFLPTVRAVVHKAFLQAEREWPRDRYVQVLNLFYLCNRDLRQAKTEFAAIAAPPRCPTERRPLPWTWFAWGGPNPDLDSLKGRFLRRRWHNPFFHDNAAGVAIRQTPGAGDHARHTQGMPHAGVVGLLAELLRETA